MIRLPPVGLALPASWTAVSDERWLKLRKDAYSLRGTVPLSREFVDAAEALRASLKLGAHDEVVEAIRSRTGARALIWLWCEVDGDSRNSVSTMLIQALQMLHPQPGLLMLGYLELAYFARFDELDDLDASGTTETIRLLLAGYLAEGWSRHGRYSAEQISWLIAEDAPALVARSIRSGALNVVDALAAWNLEEHTGRFVELVRHSLFLDELRTLPLGDGGPLLDDLREAKVHGAPYLRGRLLGHAALTILIERAEWDYPGDIWRDAVLEIAGDPRLHHLPGFTRWWAVLKPEHAERVMSWLAKAELALFLEVLQKFSESQPDMQRMLPARRKLLEGLVDEGLVRRSRLFLGSRVRSFVATNSPSTMVGDSARLDGGTNAERALLYLDCGDFHIVEGSHNTKLWIYFARPGGRLTDPRARSFKYKELTGELAESFEVRRSLEQGDGYSKGHTSVAHQGLWQLRFLEFLAFHGVAVNPESLLVKSDYLSLRERGLPVVRQRTG